MPDDKTQNQNPDSNINPAQIREKLQQDIVSIITKKLESGEMNEEKAKQIAKMTLDKLPEGISYEKLMEVVPTLDDEFEELRVAVLPIIIEYQESLAKQTSEKISELLKQQRYKDALEMAKKAVEFENNLV